MNKDFGLLLIQARQSAGMTQEKASELLDISTRTLAKYEGNQTKPSMDGMYKICKLYNNSYIGYEYVRTYELGRLLYPELENNSLAEKGLSFLDSLNTVSPLQTDIIKICLDNKIDVSEQSKFKKIVDTSKGLIKAVFGLRFYKAKSTAQTKRRTS